MVLLRNRRIVPHAVRVDKMNEIADIGRHIDEAASLEACMGGVPPKRSEAMSPIGTFSIKLPRPLVLPPVVCEAST